MKISRHIPAADARVKGVCLALLLVTLLIYAPVNFYEFVNYDDVAFITANPMVLPGLSAEGLQWAFGTSGVDYWRPLSWMSHMLDVELFALDAGAHHAVSLLLHATNALLLFLVLRRMSGHLWPSAFVAALFAWHPLHVESVAWIAERKDVLCAFFWFLTMWAYAWYAEAPSWRRYGLVVGCFVLGLMSKPMIITLPFVLLLLDVWPLRRWQPQFMRSTLGEPADSGLRARPAASLGRLVLEKLPLLALALAISAATYAAADKIGSVSSLVEFPLADRIINALTAYATYLGKMVWPVDLAVIYPVQQWGKSQLISMTFLLVALTALAVWQTRSKPYLLVGWLWFLGTLVPVIGLVHAGAQSFADRYTYLPLIGIFIMVAWGMSDLLSAWRQRTTFLKVTALVALAGCLAVTGRQLTYWENSYTLFRHALAITPNHPLPVSLLGSALVEQGRMQEALPLLQKSLRMAPESRDACLCLGWCHLQLGNHEQARYYTVMGLRLCKIPVQAAHTVSLFIQAAGAKLDDPETRYDLAAVMAAAGRMTNALEQYGEVLRLKPDYTEVWIERGALLTSLGQVNLAVADYTAALRVAPTNEIAHRNLGDLLANQGRVTEAIAHYQSALQTNPTNGLTHHNLALALARQGRAADAVAAFRSALHYHPNLPMTHDRLAWLLATHPDDAIRNGPEAIRLAERANALLKENPPAGFADTLAAAYAEAGRFPEAEVAERRAQSLAQTAGLTHLAAPYQSRLELYRARQPYRTPPVPPAPPLMPTPATGPAVRVN